MGFKNWITSTKEEREAKFQERTAALDAKIAERQEQSAERATARDAEREERAIARDARKAERPSRNVVSPEDRFAAKYRGVKISRGYLQMPNGKRYPVGQCSLTIAGASGVGAIHNGNAISSRQTLIVDTGEDIQQFNFRSSTAIEVETFVAKFNMEQKRVLSEATGQEA